MGGTPKAAEGHEPQQSWSRLGLWAGAPDSRAVSQTRVSDKGDLRVVSGNSQARFPKASGWAGNPKGEDVFLETYLLPVPSSSPSWASCLAWSPREAISFLSSAVADSSASHIQVHGDPGVPGRLFPGSVSGAVTGTWWWGSFAPRRIPESKLRHWSKASIKAGPWVW